MNLSNFLHTVKYVKPSQIYFRVVKRFIQPKANVLVAKAAEYSGTWITQQLYEQRIFDNKVVFLNKEATLNNAKDWNDNNKAKLWLYNLHYFDDLNAKGAGESRKQHVDFILKWIDQNPAPKGNGWEPYPTSLRITNWVKSFLSGLPYDHTMLNSLAQQADFLSQDLERHILGNHLFVNAKALIFAGTFLQGDDAQKWLRTGLNIFNKELEEQVLDDGGNFELTPMYHAIMLVDLLDLINLWAAYPSKIAPEIVERTKKVAAKMLTWLKIMSHADEQVSFFNDTAFGIAPANSSIFEYAALLNVKSSQNISSKDETLNLYDLKDSGYVVVKNANYSLLADLARVGPSYQPGHAHADTLSYEFSLGKQRVFVNSGISEYGLSEERLRQRKTAAHNTVVVDGLDSSQVWSGFRVAKRATVINRTINPLFENKACFIGSHNGFKKQGLNCIHTREWQAGKSSLEITDRLVGKYKIAMGFLHLHPSVEVISSSDEFISLSTQEYNIYVDVTGAKVSLEDSSWHPEFGQSIKSSKICFLFEQSTLSLSVSWQRKQI
jgi:uncharacterized heparinase superfamily protein